MDTFLKCTELKTNNDKERLVFKRNDDTKFTRFYFRFYKILTHSFVFFHSCDKQQQKLTNISVFFEHIH